MPNDDSLQLANSNDTSEYMVRRLDEYERMVSTLLASKIESHENLPNVLRSFENIEILLSRLNVLRQEFEAHSDSLQDDDLNTNQECNICCGFECRTERQGWPRFEISQSQLEALNREFSALTDDQLDNIGRGVLQCTPSAGLRLVQGSLRRQGLIVQRSRVLCSLRRVDPVTSSLWNSHEII